MDVKKRKEILKLYEGLRVTDVNDGMDAIGLHNIGIMSREIRPLWRDIENFSHRIYGFALTARFLPTNEPMRNSSVEEYLQKKDYVYQNITPEGFCPLIQKDDIVVIDCSTFTDVGFCGSNNTFEWINRGANGVVTNGGARDTDELLKQKLPVYSQYIGRGIRPGRIIYDTHNIPVNVGGVLVNPGDFIVADGDGVVCVPIDKAIEVANIARGIQNEDKAIRKMRYQEAGRELDFTVL